MVALLGACSQQPSIEQHDTLPAARERPTLEANGLMYPGDAVGVEVPIFEVPNIDTHNKSIVDLVKNERYMNAVYGKLYEANNEAELGDQIKQMLSEYNNHALLLYTGSEDPYEMYFNQLIETINRNNEMGATFLSYSKSIEKTSDGYYIDVFNQYTTNKIEMVTINQQLEEVLTALSLEKRTPVEQLQEIYGYIIEEMTYVDSGELYAYSPLGFLKYKEGVCQSYAVTIMLLLEKLGIENRYIVGEIATEQGIEYHAWNLVKLDDHWYHLDATWDDTGHAEGEEWSYFLVSDEIMQQSRSWNRQYYEQSPENYDANNL